MSRELEAKGQSQGNPESMFELLCHELASSKGFCVEA